MAICVIENVTGQLEATATAMAECTGWALLDPSEWASVVQPVDFALMGITPANILLVYSWGAGAILSVWALAYAIMAAKKVISQA